MNLLSRILLLLAGVLGAAGVAAAAAASHGESRNLSAIATIFLAHAPVLLVLALHGRSRLLGGAAVALAAGTLVFGSDLALRQWMGHALFPGAAPLGGVTMMLGWLLIVVAGVAAKGGAST